MVTREPSTPTITIEGVEGETLNLKGVARILDGFQDLYYLIGEEVQGRPYRAGGYPPSDTRELFALQPSRLRTGSVVIECNLPQQQAGLFDGKTPAESVRDKVEDIMGALQDSPAVARARLSAAIGDSRRRRRVLETLHHMHAGPQRQQVTVTYGNHRSVFTRDMAERAREIRDATVEEETPEHLLGWLHALDLKSRTCRIASASGGTESVVFEASFVDHIRQALGRVVRVRKPEDQEAWRIEDPSDLKVLSALPIDRIELPFGEVHIDPAIEFDFVVDSNKLFIATNDAFSIVASGKTFDAAVTDAQIQLSELWEIYVEEDDENLDEGAMEFKAFIQRRLGVEA